jgi:hypothetical protein
MLYRTVGESDIRHILDTVILCSRKTHLKMGVMLVQCFICKIIWLYSISRSDAEAYDGELVQIFQFP